MSKSVNVLYGILFILIIFPLCVLNAQGSENDKDIVQAQVILTVSESKRLIAKGVAQMPIVKKALSEGMIIIARGTSNTYVAQEITGRKIKKGEFVTGRVFPVKGGKKFDDMKRLPEIVLVNGVVADDLSLDDAVNKLKPGDVVIKGANALDYKNKTAGVIIGHRMSSSSGTTGKIMPYIVGRKAHLVIPVGLEKLVAGNLVEQSLKMREPVESLNYIPSMFLLTGDIMTEIEALKLLTGVTAFQAAAGGIGGAEGAVRLIVRGTKKRVEDALKVTGEIQGEPPFVE